MPDELLNPDHLRFAYPLPVSILRGRKTATVRYDLERGLSSEDRIELRNPEDMVFAHATITHRFTCRVEDAADRIDEQDGRYPMSAGGIISSLNAHYDECITGRTPVEVVLFEDVEPMGRFEEVADL